MKIEVVITVWDDGVFRLRDRIEANSFESLDEQYEFHRKSIEDTLSKPKYPFMEDDDIPF